MTDQSDPAIEIAPCDYCDDGKAVVLIRAGLTWHPSCGDCADWWGHHRKARLVDRAEVERLREAVAIALAALEGYLQGESGLPFTDPYRAARSAAEALRFAFDDREGRS